MDNILVNLTMDFSVEIVLLVKEIKLLQKESILSTQLLRCATSIGANVREANYAHSKADFIAKLQISLKECYESEYWIELLFKTDYITSDTSKKLLQSAGNIRRILVKSINTAKANNK